MDKDEIRIREILQQIASKKVTIDLKSKLNEIKEKQKAKKTDQLDYL